MFFGDKKKIGSLPGTEVIGEEPTLEYEEMLTAASSEMLEAVTAADPEAFKTSLKNFIEICGSHTEEPIE